MIITVGHVVIITVGHVVIITVGHVVKITVGHVVIITVGHVIITMEHYQSPLCLSGDIICQGDYNRHPTCKHFIMILSYTFSV